MLPIDTDQPTHVVEISTDADVVLAQRCARQLAAEMGFPRQTQWEVATAVSEAATNILKYGVRGRIELYIAGHMPARLEFRALDCGAGIDDLAQAMLDGFSAGSAPRKGLGCGLGAIHRLMDWVCIETLAAGGTMLRAHKLDPTAGRTATRMW